MSGAQKQRITCASCQKYFIITSTQVSKVKCPNCGAINQLVVDSSASAPVSNYGLSKDPVPEYTVDQVARIARGLLDESLSNWVEVSIPHIDNIENCYKRVYGYDRDRTNEVYVTKAKAYVNAPKRTVQNVYWDHELEWDNSTTGMVKVVEDYGNNRLLLKEHKTTSAATLRNDLVVRAIYEEYPDYFWSYAVSEKCDRIPEKGGWRRGHLVLQGCLITEVEPNRCEVEFINCFDFGGWIHMKFIDEEQKKVGIRLSRMKKRAEDDYKLEVHRAQERSYQYQQPAHQPAHQPQQSSSGGNVVYSEGSVCNICPSCKTISSAKFCGNDGTRLELACSSCYAPVQGNKFCLSCGAKLVL
jgi:phage FluMu protein Com